MNRDPFTTILLRLEGLALGLICVWLFRSFHASWWMFALLIFAPDLSMLGYLAGPRVGAILRRVGPKVTRVASTQSGALATTLRELGGELTTAGRSLSTPSAAGATSGR